MEKGSSPERACVMFMSLLGFGMSIMLSNFHMCGMMLLFKSVLYMVVRYVSPIGHM